MPRGAFLKVLSFLNWILLAVGALTALLYAVVCLMMLPYPELVAQAGGGLGHAIRTTLVLLAFTAVAGVSAWLLHKRVPYWWLGQTALALAVAGVAWFAITQR